MADPTISRPRKNSVVTTIEGRFGRLTGLMIGRSLIGRILSTVRGTPA
jgi:hypothetical protein